MKSLKSLIPYIRPHYAKLALVFVFGLIMSASAAAVAPIAKKLFEAFENKDSEMLTIIPPVLVVVYVFHAISRYAHLFMLKMVAERVGTRFQQDLQSKYMDLNLTYYNKSETGGMIAKVISDVAIIVHGFKIIADIIREPFTLIFIFGYLIYLDWKLTLIVFCLGPVAVFILNRIAKSVKKYSHQQQETIEQLTSTLKETVDGVRIIQSFNLQAEMKNRLSKIVDYYLRMRRRVIARQEGAGPITEVLAICAVAGLFYYIGHQIISGESTISSFMGFFTALAIAQAPIKKLQDGFVRIQQPIASIERLNDVLGSGEIIEEAKDAVPFPKDWESIEFKNVSFSYGNELVLKNVNLKVNKGESIALVGESGSGKSSLVNLLERFFDPQNGEITIGGKNIKNIQLKDLRQNVSLVSQDVFLFNDTVKRNIESGNFMRQGADPAEAARLANAHTFIEKAPDKYESPAGDRGSRFSGGEKQRISIARAIYKDAPILILDEATSALDSVSEQEVQKGLDELMQGRTAFVIAHRLSTVAKVDRIIVMKKGEIIEVGNHDQLMANRGDYFKFHELQSRT